MLGDLAIAFPTQENHSPWGSWQNDRRKFWKSVAKRFEADITKTGQLKIDEEELAVIKRLGNGVVWMEMVSKEHREIYHAMYTELKGKPSEYSTRIEKDVPRTFGVFTTDWNSKLRHRLGRQARYAALTRVLNAAATLTSAGYAQGMNFLAAALLLEVPEGDAFCLLAVLLNQRCLSTVFEKDSSGLVDYMNIFEDLLKEYVPRVWAHLREEQFAPFMYAIEWFTTLFLVGGRPALALCALDLVLAGVPDAPLRLGLALCKVLEAEVLGLGEEALQLRFKPLARRVAPQDAVPLALTAGFSQGVGAADVLARLQRRVEMAGPPGAAAQLASRAAARRWRAEVRRAVLDGIWPEDTEDPFNDSESDGTQHGSLPTSPKNVTGSGGNLGQEDDEEDFKEIETFDGGGKLLKFGLTDGGKSALKEWLERRLEANGEGGVAAAAAPREWSVSLASTSSEEQEGEEEEEEEGERGGAGEGAATGAGGSEGRRLDGAKPTSHQKEDRTVFSMPSLINNWFCHLNPAKENCNGYDDGNIKSNHSTTLTILPPRQRVIPPPSDKRKRKSFQEMSSESSDEDKTNKSANDDLIKQQGDEKGTMRRKHVSDETGLLVSPVATQAEEGGMVDEGVDTAPLPPLGPSCGDSPHLVAPSSMQEESTTAVDDGHRHFSLLQEDGVGTQNIEDNCCCKDHDDETLVPSSANNNEQVDPNSSTAGGLKKKEEQQVQQLHNDHHNEDSLSSNGHCGSCTSEARGLMKSHHHHGDRSSCSTSSPAEKQRQEEPQQKH